MATDDATLPIGPRIYGLGVMLIGVLGLAWGNFDPGQPVPKALPFRTALAYAAAAFLAVAGAGVQWRRTMAAAAAALGGYYLLVVVLLMNGPVVLAHYAAFGSYSGSAEQLAIAAGALIIYASSANIEVPLAVGLGRSGRMVFSICALLFGGAHFFYMNLTAPLVPEWLAPSQEFWGYATGVAQLAAGVAVLTGVIDRRAAILLAVMYASFLLLVWAPALLADPVNQSSWAEAALTLALTGSAWVVADSLALPRRSSGR